MRVETGQPKGPAVHAGVDQMTGCFANDDYGVRLLVEPAAGLA